MHAWDKLDHKAQFGFNIEKLPHGATCSFNNPQRQFEGLWRVNFAEKEVWSLRKGASATCMVIETRLANFS